MNVKAKKDEVNFKMTKNESAMKALDAEGRIISLGEAAKMLGTSYPTVLRLATNGELKAFRIRRTWRTSEAACEAYVQKQLELQATACQSVEVEG